MYCGDCIVLCDDYVALKLKFPATVDINSYSSSMHVFLFMSLQEGPPGGSQVSTDEQQI